MESNQRYTITSALPYTNGPLHIGHLAGAYIPADIFARFKRLTDNDVAYIYSIMYISPCTTPLTVYIYLYFFYLIWDSFN